MNIFLSLRVTGLEQHEGDWFSPSSNDDCFLSLDIGASHSLSLLLLSTKEDRDQSSDRSFSLFIYLLDWNVSSLLHLTSHRVLFSSTLVTFARFDIN